jgi:HSP20 family protein
MLNVEQAFAEVASVYQALTGEPFKPGRYELPPEVNPLEQAEANYRQFKRLMEQKSQNGGDPRKPATPMTAVVPPPVDVTEFEREVRICVDMPGVTREQVNVSVLGDTLTIRAERGANRHPAGNCRLEERPKGTLLRSITLPPRGRREGIEALLREGVLTISIPTDGASNDKTEIPIEVK